MRTDYLKLIILVITTALVGIVAIQVYWIKNAVNLKEQEFQQLVNRVLVDVSYQVEKDEAIAFLESHDLGKTLLNNSPRIVLKESMSVDTSSSDGKGLSLNIENSKEINTDTNEVHERTKVSLSESGADVEESSENRVLLDLMKESQMMNRKDVFQQILMDFLHKGPHLNVMERVDINRMEFLIKAGLSERGINAKFTFGIIAPGENVVYQPEWVKQSSLMNSPYKVKLFANDYVSSANYLSIFFPYQKGYILKSMAGIMSVSIVFILAICWTFWYTIKTIYSQKRLAMVKNDFINNMTHELKTPISTISLACEMLGDKSFQKSEEMSDHYVNMISGENKRLGNLVERVLQSAVLDKGDFKLRRESVSIHELLEKVISSSSVKVESKGGKILSKLDAENVYHSVDRVHISNVFYNLIDNAVKYTKEVPEIVVGTKDTDRGLLIWVKDNGIGIIQLEQKKIFDKLYRVPTGNVHDVKGFGLGLSYVKAIVDKHKAEIKVKSKLGQGSTFEILILNKEINE